MSLIVCPICQRRVSSQAKACPDCGHPIAKGRRPVVTIEQTEKRWKLLHALGSIGFFVGILMSFSSPGPGIFLIIVSVVSIVISKLGAWWTNS